MKKHNGMRPQDVMILFKIISILYQRHEHRISIFSKEYKVIGQITKKKIADSLSISQSEVTESLARSTYAGLYNDTSQKVMAQAFLDFLQFGLKYVFPQIPGALTRGIPTAHSAKPLADMIKSDEIYVWPDAEGTIRGQSIEPLYPTVPKAISNDKILYEMLALADAIRVGKAREVVLAVEELKKRIFVEKGNESSN